MVLTAVLAAGAVVPVLLMMVRKAGAPVPALLALSTAAAAAAIAAARAETGALPGWWLPVPWLVSVLGVPLALADARHRRLPDVLTLPAYPAVALTVTLAALAGGGWRLAIGAVLGSLLLGGTHLAVHRLSPGGLGPGDVKLAGSCGAVLGAVGGLAPATGTVLAALVSAVAIGPMWVIRRVRDMRQARETAVPASARTGRPSFVPICTVAADSPEAAPRRSSLSDGDQPGLNLPRHVQPCSDQPRPGLESGYSGQPDLEPGRLDGPRLEPGQPGDSGLEPGHPADPCLEPPDPDDSGSGPGRRADRRLEPPRPADRRLEPTHSDDSGLEPGHPADPCLEPPHPDHSGPEPSPSQPNRNPRRSSHSLANPAPTRRKTRAGPLRVPYGPGLLMATWACAVFPAAGTGIG